MQMKGYVPCYLIGGGSANYRGGPNPERYQAMGGSGVTIATGCDLGQTDQKTLLNWGLSPAIARLFQYYYGRRRAKAIEALHKRPLAITEPQAVLVNQAVHLGYLTSNVIPAYDKASAVPFKEIPREAQAVVMSMCFQKGCAGVARDWPRAWGHLINQRWAAASQELCHGFTQYVSRRKTEGALLRGLA